MIRNLKQNVTRQAEISIEENKRRKDKGNEL